MRTYDLIVVFRPSIAEAKRKKMLETMKTWLKDVSIAKEDTIGLKALAYKIKKETSGFFSKLSLEAKDSIPTDFEKRLITSEDIIRHLLIRKK